MFSVTKALYQDLCVRTQTPIEQFTGKASSQQLLKALTEKISQDMGLSPKKINFSNKRLDCLSPFFPSPEGSSLEIPPIYLLDIKEIPSQYVIRDEKDFRLKDRNYLRGLQNFLVSYFENQGINISRTRLGREILGCEILAVTKALQNPSLAAKTLEYSLRLQMTRIAHHTKLKTQFLQFADFSLSILAATAIAMLVPSGFFLTVVVAMITFVVAKTCFNTFFSSKLIERMYKADIRATVAGKAEMIEAAFALCDQKNNFASTLMNSTDESVRPLFRDSFQSFQNRDTFKTLKDTLREEKAKLKEEKAI